MGYLSIEDLSGDNSYFEQFAESFYGTNGTLHDAGSVKLLADIENISRYVDDKLRTTGRFSVLPIQRNESGVYPRAVVDWCAYLLLYRKSLARFQTEFGEIPPVVSNFQELSNDAATIVLDGNAIFDSEIAHGELGIGQPTPISLGTDTRGTFYNNWRGFPYGDSGRWIRATPPEFAPRGQSFIHLGYLGQDYPRRFVFEVIEEGGIGTSKCRWSRNSGREWVGTVTTSDNWIDIMDNVFVRFGEDSSGSNFFSVDDSWSFMCVPRGINYTRAPQEAQVSKSSRGF